MILLLLLNTSRPSNAYTLMEQQGTALKELVDFLSCYTDFPDFKSHREQLAEARCTVFNERYPDNLAICPACTTQLDHVEVHLLPVLPFVSHHRPLHQALSWPPSLHEQRDTVLQFLLGTGSITGMCGSKHAC